MTQFFELCGLIKVIRLRPAVIDAKTTMIKAIEQKKQNIELEQSMQAMTLKKTPWPIYITRMISRIISENRCTAKQVNRFVLQRGSALYEILFLNNQLSFVRPPLQRA